MKKIAFPITGLLFFLTTIKVSALSETVRTAELDCLVIYAFGAGMALVIITAVIGSLRMISGILFGGISGFVATQLFFHGMTGLSRVESFLVSSWLS
jgi:uncharacterized membrane protein required for colicin V production